MLKGFTPRGLAALVAAPPWHYAGWLLNVEFACSRDRARDFVHISGSPPRGATAGGHTPCTAHP
jgi:hypothetical protein